MASVAHDSKPVLSICMIVKNEAENLPRALASAQGLDAELLVVDTGSTDATVDVALQAGARVEHFVWVNDFSAARNFAFEKARGQWLFVLDADEALTPELRVSIQATLEASKAGAIRIPVSSVDERGILQMQAPSTRIFRNGRGYAYEGRVHERAEMSVLRAGDTIEDADLPMTHYGYTAAEDARKQRHRRNLELVMREHECSPHDPRHWHYLGLQHAIVGDYEHAARWFERVVTERSDHELAGWSASQLAAIRMAQRAFGAAWTAAQIGTQAPLGRVASLLTLGEITLRDGDGHAALECAMALAKVPDDSVGDCGRRAERAIILKARALAALGNSREAYALLVRAVRKQPDDSALADELVKMAERIDRSSRATVMAAKDTQGARSVIAAGMGTFVRLRAWQQAVAIGERHELHNEYFAHALGRVGRTTEARDLLVGFGPSAATQLLLAGFDCNDSVSVGQALEALSPKAAVAAEHVLTERRVPEELEWILVSWIELAIALRSDAIVDRLVRSLPRPRAASAIHALLRYAGGEPMTALQIALTCADEPDALEVIGLVAHDNGDKTASAAMLTQRARAGDVSVRVILRGCEALRAIGKHAAAEQLLVMGRESRPHSLALGAGR